jgi:hypothetical protein
VRDDPPVDEPLDQFRVREAASGVYGLVIVAAVLATSTGFGAFGPVVVSVVVTLLVYWAAETYSHVLGSRLVAGRALTRDEMWRGARQGWPLVSASFVPLAALLVAHSFGADLTVAVVTALVVTTMLLVVVAFKAARDSGVRGIRLFGATALSASFGVVMIALKFSLH